MIRGPMRTGSTSASGRTLRSEASTWSSGGLIGMATCTSSSGTTPSVSLSPVQDMLKSGGAAHQLPSFVCHGIQMLVNRSQVVADHCRGINPPGGHEIFLPDGDPAAIHTSLANLGRASSPIRHPCTGDRVSAPRDRVSKLHGWRLQGAQAIGAVFPKVNDLENT
jgi:hypothetical protein